MIRDTQKKRWEDNIKEKTGMDFASSASQIKTGQGERDCCKVSCGAQTARHDYGIN